MAAECFISSQRLPSVMPSTYHSPGKEPQQHNIQMFDTQINLGASDDSTSEDRKNSFSCWQVWPLASLISLSVFWVKTVILSTQFICFYECGKILFFSSGLGDTRYLGNITRGCMCLFVQMRMKNGVWEIQGCEGAKLSQAIHSLWPLCLINGPHSYMLLHQRVCHSLIMWPSVAHLMTLEE